jgi:glutaminase
MDLPSIEERAQRPSVSTGHLPAAETVHKLVPDAHRCFNSNTGGHNFRNSQVYPALANRPSDLFGACLVGGSGSGCAAGNTGYEFSIMNVSKPFVFALARLRRSISLAPYWGG